MIESSNIQNGSGTFSGKYLHPDPGQPQTLCHLLLERAQEDPDRPVFTFLDRLDPNQSGRSSGGSEFLTTEDFSAEDDLDFGVVGQITEGQLLNAATRLAVRLSEKVNPGDRVIIALLPGIDFIVAFFACLLARVIAVPATAPRPNRKKSRLDGLIGDSEAKAILLNEAILSRLSSEWVANHDSLALVPADDWHTSLSSNEVDETSTLTENSWNLSPESIAFLQYTSGSTSEPKGVVVTHENIMRNLDVIGRGFRKEQFLEWDGERVCSFWLPPYHDMGLVGAILMPYFDGWRTVLMSPTSFLQRPDRWLRALSRTRSLLTGAPNFAFDYCVEKISTEQSDSLNLADLRLMFCGAEPIRANSLRRFATRFQATGFRQTTFYPCYGMAECTLMATGGDGPSGISTVHLVRSRLLKNEIEVVESIDESSRATIEVVSCGTPHSQHLVQVVDPNTCRPVDDGHLGEVWIQGRSVAAGYWGKERESSEIFEAVSERAINGALGAEDQSQTESNASVRWLRTGDLGFIRAGELYLTGRLKDLIVVRGQNHFPQDIEQTVSESAPGLPSNSAIAFGIDNQVEEGLVVVQEVDRSQRQQDHDQTLQQVRRNVLERHDVEPSSIVLVRQAGLPRTSSGKVQRKQCRQQFINDELKVIARWDQPTGGNGRDPEDGGSLGVGSERPTRAALNDLGDGDVTEIIEHFLVRWIQERVKNQEAALGPNSQFSDVGLDSITAVEMSFELEKWLEITIDPDAAWSHTTPRSLADYLTAVVRESQTSA